MKTSLMPACETFFVGWRCRGKIDRDGDDPVRVLLDRVLDIGNLLVDLIFGRSDPGDRNAVFLERVRYALHLKLGRVEVHGLHRDAHLEMAGLHLLGLSVAELKHFR